jgi:hypothetical protein
MGFFPGLNGAKLRAEDRLPVSRFCSGLSSGRGFLDRLWRTREKKLNAILLAGRACLIIHGHHRHFERVDCLLTLSSHMKAKNFTRTMPGANRASIVDNASSSSNEEEEFGRL